MSDLIREARMTLWNPFTVEMLDEHLKKEGHDEGADGISSLLTGAMIDQKGGRIAALSRLLSIQRLDPDEEASIPVETLHLAEKLQHLISRDNGALALSLAWVECPDSNGHRRCPNCGTPVTDHVEDENGIRPVKGRMGCDFCNPSVFFPDADPPDPQKERLNRLREIVVEYRRSKWRSDAAEQKQRDAVADIGREQTRRNVLVDQLTDVLELGEERFILAKLSLEEENPAIVRVRLPGLSREGVRSRSNSSERAEIEIIEGE